MGRTFFTADQHFGHENIIRFCDRPFAPVEEMDREGRGPKRLQDGVL